jgi:hypothetical protein
MQDGNASYLFELDENTTEMGGYEVYIHPRAKSWYEVLRTQFNWPEIPQCSKHDP